MVRLSASEFKQEMSETLNRVAYQGERVVIHRRGKDVAVLINTEEAALLEMLEDFSDLRAAKEAMAEGGEPVSIEDVKKELGL